MNNEHYVYVYIDPRNNEEFYFGKGKDSRKNAHSNDPSDTEKTRRIVAIKKAGLEPIIRVIARNLSDREALLVEKTLLWKLGKQLTNISSGHYVGNFRPHDTIHLELSGFDYRRGIYYYNVGECHRRNWDDYKQHNIISAGGGIRWRDAILGLEKGDSFAAYLKKFGFVGIGTICERAKPIREVTVNGRPLLSLKLKCKGMSLNVENDDKCEYVAKVEWKAAVDRKLAKWESGLYTTPLVRASLDGQPETTAFLEKEFGFKFSDLVR